MPNTCVFSSALLLVHDVSGDPLPSAISSENGAPLSTELTSVSCSPGSCTHAVSPPAAGPVTISMPGYQDAAIDFVPAYGACGAPMRMAYDVGLRPTNDAMASMAAGPILRGSGCGQ